MQRTLLSLVGGKFLLEGTFARRGSAPLSLTSPLSNLMLSSPNTLFEGLIEIFLVAWIKFRDDKHASQVTKIRIFNLAWIVGKFKLHCVNRKSWAEIQTMWKLHTQWRVFYGTLSPNQWSKNYFFPAKIMGKVNECGEYRSSSVLASRVEDQQLICGLAIPSFTIVLLVVTQFRWDCVMAGYSFLIKPIFFDTRLSILVNNFDGVLSHIC